MEDLINRQEAISDFEWCKSQAIDKDRWQEAIDRINALQSADVVEIVRCYECVWWNTCPSSTIAPTFHRCKRVGRMGTEANDFCSYGERKDG